MTDFQNILGKIDNSISELIQLKEQLLQLITSLENKPKDILFMSELFTGVPTYNGLNKRVANILKGNNLYDIPVEVFIIKCSPKRFCSFRNSSKKSEEYVRKVLKEELSIDW